MPAPDINYQQRVAYVMEHWPETRGDEALLLVRYWTTYDGLGDVMDEATLARFTAWLRRKETTCAETIRRRRQEIHSGGYLLPDAETLDYRARRARAGPPRR